MNAELDPEGTEDVDLRWWILIIVREYVLELVVEVRLVFNLVLHVVNE